MHAAFRRSAAGPQPGRGARREHPRADPRRLLSAARARRDPGRPRGASDAVGQGARSPRQTNPLRGGDRAGGEPRLARRPGGPATVRGACRLGRLEDGMSHAADAERYERMPYRRTGRSGLLLPAVSLGLWNNFGADRPLETSRAIVGRAFDLGITHFDLANNYGPPYGSAEENFGRIVRDDLRPYRDELLISTKAGYDMWPGPYGDGGSRKYLLSSLDQSLSRMGLDYVDIFYSHRADPETPLEETMGALHTAVTSGRALYAGISSYSPERTAQAAAILRQLGTPLLIHQPSYSMLNRWVEDGLLDTLAA